MAVKNELVGINNKPSLYVFNSCERTIWEFGRYQWDDWRGNSKENRSLKERPKDKDDHAMECLYRLLLQDIKWRTWTTILHRLNTRKGTSGNEETFDCPVRLPQMRWGGVHRLLLRSQRASIHPLWL